MSVCHKRRRINKFLTLRSNFAQTMNKLIGICIVLLLTACDYSSEDNSSNVTKSPESINMNPDHASWYQVSGNNDYSYVKIINPWDTTQLLEEYILTKSDQLELPEQYKGIKQIKVPIQSMACLSGSHFIMAKKLGVFDRIKAVGEVSYILNEEILEGIENGIITSIQANGVIDPEKALIANPDVIFASPYENSDFSDLEQFGLTVIPFADYMELDPVGRAEWIRFMALFFGKEQVADSIVNSIEQEYDRVKKLVLNTGRKPTLFSDKPFRGIWYLPGGESYMARIFDDAGADYLWRDEASSGSLSLDFEVVYNKAAEADFWRLFITQSGPFDYQKLQAIDERFVDFKAFKDKQVIICKTVESRYFEKAGMEPEIVLADLARIFHPEQFPDHQPVYFTVLK